MRNAKFIATPKRKRLKMNVEKQRLISEKYIGQYFIQENDTASELYQGLKDIFDDLEISESDLEDYMELYKEE